MNESPTQQIPRIGLTGGIGCGKSMAANEFIRLGAQVIDSDALARQVTMPGGLAMPAIFDAFGKEFFLSDGALNRDKLREYVFNHKPALAILEKITHPLIQEASKTAVEEASKKNPPYIVCMIPLLFESNTWQGKFNKIIVIDCAKENQIQRVMLRSKLPREQIEQIMAAQLPREDRLKNADFVINNDGLLIDMNLQIADIHEKLIQA